jgi:hypothetical protein
MERPLALMLAGLLLLGFGAIVHADDAALGPSGETVFPISEPAVAMQAVTVHLTVEREKTRVDLSFTFANKGPDRMC